MTSYGYARVSTDGQTLDAQIAALKAAGAEKVYSEKQSGATTDRAALGRVLAALESGDVLMVTRLDRLARSTRDLACTRFRRHRVRCFDGAGGASWRDGSLPVSSSLRLFG
jgi:DNA invertase Pin-like site-specific DNA recombinase